MAHLVLAASILLQFAAAAMALLLIRKTGWKAAWSLIAIAMGLMGVRRSISFYNLVTSSHLHSPDDSAEVIALVISTLMVIGVAALGPLFARARRSERALSASEASLKRAQRIARFGNWDWDIPSEHLHLSSESFRILAVEPKDFAHSSAAAYAYVHPEDRSIVKGYLAAALKSPGLTTFEHRFVRADGSEGIALQVAETEFDARGNPVRMTGTVQDITHRKQVEDLNSRLGRIIEDSVNEVYIFDSETLRFLQVNRGARQNLGYSMEELKSMTPLDIKPLFDQDSFTEILQPLLSGEKELLRFETIHCRKDDSTYDISVRLQLAQQESPPVFFAIIEDITERRQTEAALRQAQKMEAVGQLTGGLAHDFRNLLTVMIGNLELVELKMAADDPLLPRIQKASLTARKGSDLVQRLLAFTRRQPLRTDSFNAGELIDNMTDILERALGESIKLEVSTEAGLWQCETDPTQLENVLLNLSINARDAMPDGGKLRIRTSNQLLTEGEVPEEAELRPGRYILVSIEDTGVGIPKEIIDRVFEPFFTTKEIGAGSGLGLSMVFGFAKQSGGHITIHSEKRKGTTAKLYLPVPSDKAASTPEHIHAEDSESDRGHGETILVVEDDQTVRLLVASMVRELNYTAIEARDAESAMRLIDPQSSIMALLVDVDLPGGMNGVEFAETVRRQSPSTLTVYMSAHTQSALFKRGWLKGEETFLQKPFELSALARALRKTLDSKSA